jgi:hypothetical protein
MLCNTPVQFHSTLIIHNGTQPHRNCKSLALNNLTCWGIAISEFDVYPKLGIWPNIDILSTQGLFHSGTLLYSLTFSRCRHIGPHLSSIIAAYQELRTT